VIVGMLLLQLRIPGNQSLKGKRQVIKSVIARVHNRYNVSAAEVENNDVWQTASLGVTCVSNSARHAEDILRNVVAFIEADRLDIEIVDLAIEVTHAM